MHNIGLIPPDFHLDVYCFSFKNNQNRNKINEQTNKLKPQNE